MLKPAARADLAKSKVGDEVVVYDFRNHQARCLNPTAAAVFELCDGTRSPRQIAAELGKRLGAPVNDRLVWLSLAKLDECGLFEPDARDRAHRSGASRAAQEDGADGRLVDRAAGGLVDRRPDAGVRRELCVAPNGAWRPVSAASTSHHR